MRVRLRPRLSLSQRGKNRAGLVEIQTIQAIQTESFIQTVHPPANHRGNTEPVSAEQDRKKSEHRDLEEGSAPIKAGGAGAHESQKGGEDMTEKPQAIIDSGEVFVLQPGMPIYVKTADFCAMTGKTNAWIGRLVEQGILNKKATKHGGLFDLRKNIRSYCEMLESRVKEPDPETEKLEADKAKYETQIKQARAIIALSEAGELKGKMHRSEDVQAITEDLVYSIRSLLIALPGRLAVDVANADDAAEASTIIRNEVHKIMEELARYRYDPKRYEERVRERKSWEALEADEKD